jgi:hypothetical protein
LYLLGKGWPVSMKATGTVNAAMAIATSTT